MIQSERKIDLQDYFDVNLLDGKEGKVSADRTKIRFGDLLVEISKEGMVSSEIMDCDNLAEAEEHPLSLSDFENMFPASKSVHASVMRIPSGDKLYWMLALSTPIPKKLITDKKVKNFVSVMAVGTEE